jgi:GNAT superfamily N-acetyltransferase
VIGYFEFDLKGNEIELVYFGLKSIYLGKGYGKSMMNYTLALAQKMDCKSLFLHTCSFDSPAALPFYQQNGFVIFQTLTQDQPIIIE